MITITHLSYTYPHQATPALQDVSLQVDTGEFVLIAGASGAGKSTLLRCINGLVPHFSGGHIQGEVIVAGQSVLTVGPAVMSRYVGFVLQNPEAQAILDQVEPEIAFSLENAAIPRQEMRVRVEEVLDLLDLTSVRQRPLNTLSGGERQRVAIAAALALRPQILVLDEPTSQLDPQSAADVLKALVRLNEDLGLTIILAEHRLERVLRYVDRLVHMADRQIVVDAPVAEAVAQVPHVPPLIELARRLQWQPIPLTVKAGQRFARRLSGEKPHSAPTRPFPTPSAATSPPRTAVTNLSFAYPGAKPVLQGVSLQVGAGEVVALMGRNGSGKSTLLKCLVGLLTPAAGEVWVNGRSIRGRSVADICREVAYLPQNPDDLLFADSVTAELAVTLKNHQLPQAHRIAPLLADLGVADVADAYPRDLSVGQRQRVALGAVTITQPGLLLLDEPTRGLDYAAKRSLVAIWQQWLARGMGLLLVTHDVELVAMIAHRVLILSQGEVIASGQTADVLNASPLFAPQIARLFPQQNWLTVDEALGALLTKENDQTI